ncbi:hypothetical protein KKH3_26070 [Pectobacterium actinidiae]|nr:hypothetical protein KKH3_26070 [Pectobacterium actinidiae]
MALSANNINPQYALCYTLAHLVMPVASAVTPAAGEGKHLFLVEEKT